MTGEEFIPRIQLPQIGGPPRPPTAPEDEGSVRKSDDHHERFRRFLVSGDGLENLVDGVQRDTVGRDGRTLNQRESEAEQAHQDAVVERSAVSAPRPAPRRAAGFFDDDGPVEEEEFTPAWEPLPPPPATRRVDPAPTPLVEPDGDDTLTGSAPSPPWRVDHSIDDTGHSEPETPEFSDPGPDNDADDGQPTDFDDDDEDQVRPPGSLWDSTRGNAETYEPGIIVVDPDPQRAAPGAMSEWIRRQYQHLWVPLSQTYKAAAIVVVVVLTAWVGYLSFGSHEQDAPALQAADPLVDAAPSSSAAAPAPLPPDSVKAPGCPARSQPPANAFDGKPDTAWVCVRAFNTDLQTVTITYSKPVVVTSIFVIPGFEHVDGNGRNEWNEHRVVTLISWRVGGQSFQQDIDPSAHTGSSIQIPNVATQVITGKIFKTVPPPPVEGDNGPSDADINSTFAMSTITVNGFPAGGVPR